MGEQEFAMYVVKIISTRSGCPKKVPVLGPMNRSIKPCLWKDYPKNIKPLLTRAMAVFIIT